jgi:hypothetical protein
MAKKTADADDVFKFLGFEIHPGKIRDFWESEDEKKKFVGHIRARSGKLSVLDRDGSLMSEISMSISDRVISFIGGALLIIAFFLPVFSIGPSGRVASGSAISFFLNLPFVGSYAAWGGGIFIAIVIVFSLLLLACPATGILNILGILNRNKGESYLRTIKKYSRFTYVPILLYLLLFVLLAIGGAQPFGSLGIEGLGESLNFTAIFTMTGVAFWLNIVGLALGFAQSRGL